MYDIIGFGSTHISFEQDVAVLKQFRDCCRQDVLFVVGGQEATHNFEQLLNAGFDVAILGYGEYVMLEIAKALGAYRRIGLSAFQDIEGLATKSEGTLSVQKARRVTKQDVAALFYTQILKMDIPYNRYWEVNSKRAGALSVNNSFTPEMVRLYTSTRCPSHCGYCSSHKFIQAAQGAAHNGICLSGKQVAELVVHHHRKYGARIFLFSDDEFLAWRQRSRDFCQAIIDAKNRGELDPAVAFHCQARVIDFLCGMGNIDTDLIELLRQAGFTGISLGVESFSDHLLRTPVMNKPGYDRVKTFRVIDALSAAGLRPHVFIILCVPDATPQDILDTLRSILEVVEKGCSLSISPLVYALPGAPAQTLSGYAVKTLQFISPVTHQAIPLAQYFIPRDATVASLAENFHTLETETAKRVLQEMHWTDGTVNYLMETLLRGIGIAEFFGENALAETFKKRLFASVARS